MYVAVRVCVCVLVVLVAGSSRVFGEETAGEKLVSTMDKSLRGIQNNLYKGMTAMGTPAVKFTVDTLPHLVHIYALVQGVLMPPKLVSFTKDALGRLALVAGTAASDTAVLGSSVLADVTTITAAVLEVQNDIMDKVGHKGISLAGDMVDSMVNVTCVGVDAAGVGLTALGDTLVAAAKVNSAMSGASARLITAIGTRLVGALDGVRKHTRLLTSKLLGTVARQEHATNLLSYVSTLKNAQKVFEDLVNQDSLESTTDKN